MKISSFLLFATFYFFFVLEAQGTPGIKWAGESQSLSGYLLVLEEQSGTKSLTDIIKIPDNAWKTYPSDFLKFGYSTSYYWIKFEVDATPNQQNTLYWWFESDIPQDVQFFQMVDNKVVKKNHTGTNHTFFTRDIQSRNLVFSFKTFQAKKSIIYARIHNDVGSMYCSTFLHSAEAFAKIEIRSTRLWSFFFTFMFFSALLTIGLFLIFKEKIYFFYACYLIFTALMIMSINGFGTEWLWPNSTLMANVSQVIWTFGTSAFLMCFIHQLLFEIVKDHRVINRLIVINLALLGISVLLAFNFRNIPVEYVPSFLIFGNLVMMLSVVIMAWMLFLGIYRNFKPTYYFFMAFAPVLGIGLAYYFRNLGLINWAFLKSPFAIVPPFIFEIILLFVALLTRFRTFSKIQQQQQQLEINAQLRLQEERERISRDLHDNMGAQLSHIMRSAEWFSKHSNFESKTQKEILSNMTETAKGAISTLRESIWTLNRETVEVADFVERYKKWAQPLAKSITQTTIIFKENLATKGLLQPEQSLQLFRILQEAFNNSLKYANADTITVSFQITNDKAFTVEITDTGAGFDMVEALDLGHGLANMQQRAELIGADYKIWSERNTGTTVKVSFSL